MCIFLRTLLYTVTSSPWGRLRILGNCDKAKRPRSFQHSPENIFWNFWRIFSLQRSSSNDTVSVCPVGSKFSGSFSLRLFYVSQSHLSLQYLIKLSKLLNTLSLVLSKSKCKVSPQEASARSDMEDCHCKACIHSHCT